MYKIREHYGLDTPPAEPENHEEEQENFSLLDDEA